MRRRQEKEVIRLILIQSLLLILLGVITIVCGCGSRKPSDDLQTELQCRGPMQEIYWLIRDRMKSGNVDVASVVEAVQKDEGLQRFRIADVDNSIYVNKDSNKWRVPENSPNDPALYCPVEDNRKVKFYVIMNFRGVARRVYPPDWRKQPNSEWVRGDEALGMATTRSTDVAAISRSDGAAQIFEAPDAAIGYPDEWFPFKICVVTGDLLPEN